MGTVDDVRGTPLVARAVRTRHSAHPRSPLLLHPPADPHTAALQVGPLSAPQLGEPVAVVIAVHAPDRAFALLVGQPDPSHPPVASAATAIPPPRHGYRSRGRACR